MRMLRLARGRVGHRGRLSGPVARQSKDSRNQRPAPAQSPGLQPQPRAPHSSTSQTIPSSDSPALCLRQRLGLRGPSRWCKCLGISAGPASCSALPAVARSRSHSSPRTRPLAAPEHPTQRQSAGSPQRVPAAPTSRTASTSRASCSHRAPGTRSRGHSPKPGTPAPAPAHLGPSLLLVAPQFSQDSPP